MINTVMVTSPPKRAACVRRWRIVLTSALVMLLGTPALAVEQQSDQQGRASIEAELLRHGIGLGHSATGVITAWNELAHDIAFAEDQFLTFKGQRALAMVHLAMHDALNSIVPAYQRYAYARRQMIAHPVAATAQGAYEVLISQYPDQKSKLADELAIWLAEVPNGLLRELGIELGQATAAAILALRANDGWNFSGMYEFRGGPGQYQTTPPWDGVRRFAGASRLALPLCDRRRPRPRSGRRAAHRAPYASKAR
jgi:hypothetical protein